MKKKSEEIGWRNMMNVRKDFLLYGEMRVKVEVYVHAMEFIDYSDTMILCKKEFGYLLPLC